VLNFRNFYFNILFSLRLTKYHALKTHPALNQAPYQEDVWGNGGIAPHVLNTALDVGEWSSSRPSRFSPGERGPDTHRIGSWVGPRAGSGRGDEVWEQDAGDNIWT